MMLAAVLMAVLTPQQSAIPRGAPCSNNLEQLWKMQQVYATQFGGKRKLMPQETGEAFWLKLAATQPPIIDGTLLEILVCPLSGREVKPGFTSYRGPRSSVNSLKDDDVVGCCEPGSHPDGTINVLLKNGTVQSAGPKDDLHARALKATLSTSAAKPAECKTIIGQLAMAAAMYEVDMAVYPASGNANLVKALHKAPGPKGPYLQLPRETLNAKGEVLDPWGRPLVYINNSDKSAPAGWKARNKTIDLYSFGPDGKDDQGGGDDVKNWD